MPIIKRLSPVAAVIPLFFVLLGCAAMGNRIDPPRVGLASIRVLEIRGLETTFEVDLRIVNRSKHPLAIEGIDCELTLDGRQLAEGVANPQVEIAAYADTVVPIKVHSSMFDMIGIARRLVKQATSQADGKKITYAVNGHLQIADSGLFGKIPFDSQGEIDLEGLADPVR
jgi:LEA14-like dessication related protein